jgi:hypothetical protein
MASGAKKALTHVISAIKRDYILQILIKINFEVHNVNGFI